MIIAGVDQSGWNIDYWGFDTSLVLLAFILYQIEPWFSLKNFV